ncbi:dirigent protein 22-like [Ananas comosus]|uniref:Dirigent protein n=2 Tax=Ananas comosus TaxID=4615 RepID=A0A6P5GGV5_ANACO|nr:dirigent protein 22-like [Ananas comosus]
MKGEMALLAPKHSLLLLLLLLLFQVIFSTITAANAELTTRFSERPHKKKLKEKLSHLHFYFHDIVRGKNITAVPVTAPSRSAGSPASAFGVITIMDDALTMGPEPTSAPVGRAQGMYACAALQDLGFLQAMNLVFTAGTYDGSVLTVLGRNAPLHAVREMPVVGGSGLFRFARGYAVARTHDFDAATGNAVVEYNVYVMHY